MFHPALYPEAGAAGMPAGGLLMPSQFAERFLELNDGNHHGPFRIGQYTYMRRPMDGNARHRHLVWARQCGKTLLMGIDAIAYASLVPNTAVMVISSALDNTSIFDEQKLRPLMGSPGWRETFGSSESLKENVKLKELPNGSKIILRGANKDGSRIRGISGGKVFIDELQDIERSVVEEAESVMTRFPERLLMTSGTQSYMESAVNHYLEISTQTEWMLKCSHCSRWSDGLDEKNIGKNGLICRACGGGLNQITDNPKWVRTGSPNAPVDGYRFPLLALPGHPWSDIIYKYENFSRQMFYIDVLALPFDFAGKPITMSELRASCDEDYRVWMLPEECHGRRTVVGIDYGLGLGSTTQIAVLVEWRPGKLRLAMMRKLTGSDSVPHVARKVIEQIIADYGAVKVCADQGGQTEQNPQLENIFGSDRFHGVMLVGGMKETLQYAKNDRHWVGSKTKTLTRLFMQMKKRSFVFPAWSLFEPYGQEILNELVAFNERTGEAEYDHPSGKPDDSLHALNFAFIAYLMATGEYKRLAAPNVRKRGGTMFSSG